MNYSYLIIESENIPATEIKRILDYFPKYKCLSIIKDSKNVIEEIIRAKPQLVFLSLPLDSKVCYLSFVKILEMYQYFDIMPTFVVVSNTDKFAFEALRSGISDYLLFPLDFHSVGQTLFKFEKRNIPTLSSQICIKSYTDYQFVNLNDIIYLKADNNTTDIKLNNGKIVNAYKTLKHFENSLPFNFLRIHKSYIVNVKYVSRIQFSKSKCILDYNEVLPFTTTYRQNVDSIVKKLGL